ncbi:NADH dehydrogenase [ubiquinone] flavoprotein 3, mitochondrial-like [Erinaceus europaeus]|uniref:NADH dehydrogenase [ubiquinone] flavoprotein 3, mitochondrial n=1 Tax=Erinaceus europaeus TaxID=9365 RepID=A0A1S2ZHI6_ERIEU|nr:NADH dehydrogenase [ubiquinone] flavoprotein 3, mitochondrial-like [Erinaceus europaeus]
MAALQLRQGRPGVLRTLCLGAQVLRAPTATAARSAESGKAEKGQLAAPKKQSPPKKPAAPPPEPLDNTRYRNLQHHDYTAFTFLDLNLDLAKFRMPQPSSDACSCATEPPRLSNKPIPVW